MGGQNESPYAPVPHTGPTIQAIFEPSVSLGVRSFVTPFQLSLPLCDPVRVTLA